MSGKRNCQKLRKPCRICGEMFIPYGRAEKLCGKCYKIRRSFNYIQHFEKLRELKKDELLLNKGRKPHL